MHQNCIRLGLNVFVVLTQVSAEQWLCGSGGWGGGYGHLYAWTLPLQRLRLGKQQLWHLPVWSPAADVCATCPVHTGRSLSDPPEKTDVSLISHVCLSQASFHSILGLFSFQYVVHVLCVFVIKVKHIQLLLWHYFYNKSKILIRL